MIVDVEEAISAARDVARLLGTGWSEGHVRGELGDLRDQPCWIIRVFEPEPSITDKPDQFWSYNIADLARVCYFVSLASSRCIGFSHGRGVTLLPVARAG